MTGPLICKKSRGLFVHFIEFGGTVAPGHLRKEALVLM